MATLYEKIEHFKSDDIPALYFENKTISYKNLHQEIKRMVSYLTKEGIKKGDVVTVCLPNIPVTVYLFYALDIIGAIQNIIHPLSNYTQIMEKMEEVNSTKLIILSTIYKEKEDEINNSTHTFFFVNPLYDFSYFKRKIFYLKYKKPKKNNHIKLLDEYRTEQEIKEVKYRSDKESSIYLHSGGTTGTPKIIMLNDIVINNLAEKAAKLIEGEKSFKAMLAVLPCFHGFGLGMGLHAPLANGACVTLMMKFNDKKVIKFINQNKIAFIIGVPALYSKLLKNKKFKEANLSNLEYCFIGGDNVDTTLLKEFNQVLKDAGSKAELLEGYGLTETVTVCTVNRRGHFKLGSVGKALDGIEILIVDEKLQELPTYEIGEVLISGDTLMNGYFNDQNMTNLTFINLNGKTYVRTGDLGYLDDDNFLFLKGRKKRLIKISGINVYPFEVEKLANSFPEVDISALVLFDLPKLHMNLYLKLKNNIEIDQDKLIEKMRKTLKEKLIKYSVPENIIILDKFPYTNIGKIDYNGFKDITY